MFLTHIQSFNNYVNTCHTKPTTFPAPLMLFKVDLKKDKQYTCRCFLAIPVFVIQTWGANPHMSGGGLGEPSGSFALLLEQGAGGFGFG